MSGEGSAGSPWQLKTPPGSSTFEAYRDEGADPPALVVQVGKTQLRYHLRCIDDLHAMLVAHGDWMLLGSADEQKDAAPDTVEAWGRAASNPVSGWYGIKKGFRGRFGMYVPPVLELLGLAEVEHGARNNRMRASSGAARPATMPMVVASSPASAPAVAPLSKGARAARVAAAKVAKNKPVAKAKKPAKAAKPKAKAKAPAKKKSKKK